MCWLIWAIVAALFLLTAASYVLYWYENGNQADSTRTSLFQVLSAGLDSVLGVAFLAAVYPLGRLKRIKRASVPDRNGPVIVCVHGLFHNPSAWIIFRIRLRRAGFGNCYCPAYKSFTNDISGALQELEEQLAAIRGKHPEQELILVGHSLGGLLAFFSVPNNRSRLIITMGTPFKGSKLAVFGISRLAKSLRPQSRELQAFLSKAENTAHPPGLALYTTTDNMVLPGKSLLAAPEGWRLVQTRRAMSHVGMLWSGEVAGRAIEEIQKTVEKNGTG